MWHYLFDNERDTAIQCTDTIDKPFFLEVPMLSTCQFITTDKITAQVLVSESALIGVLQIKDYFLAIPENFCSEY